MTTTNDGQARGGCVVVDVHSHLYPTFYLDLLRTRTEAPYIKDDKLINRASAAGAGKPLVPVLWEISTKIEFMDAHGIDISILSLGNPWLDFLPRETAGPTARDVNNKFNDLCNSTAPGRLFFFAVLPLSGGIDVILEEISRLKSLSHVRGVVIGCNGSGTGLDDPDLWPMYRALAEAGLPVFLHPNYGLPGEVWGPRAADYGQILQVSVGFPLETTIAMARLILSGVFTDMPGLKFIVSHAGGTLPFIAGRIEHAIDHDRLWDSKGKSKPDRQTVWDVLRKNVFLDGILYNSTPLKMTAEAAGVDRVMFGTDHPFFQPLKGGNDMVPSAWSNEKAAGEAFGKGSDSYNLVMGGNAVRVLSLGAAHSHGHTCC